MRCKEPKGIESEQGSGSEGDAVLYNTWLFRNVNTFFEKLRAVMDSGTLALLYFD